MEIKTDRYYGTITFFPDNMIEGEVRIDGGEWYGFTCAADYEGNLSEDSDPNDITKDFITPFLEATGALSKNNFGKQVKQALERKFPDPDRKALQFHIRMDRISRNTFKIAIDLNGKVNTANFRIGEGETVSIPITVNLE